MSAAPDEPTTAADPPSDDAGRDSGQDAAPAARPVRRGLVATLVVVAAVVVAIDQLSKAWALDTLPRNGTGRTVVEGWLQFRLTFNPGAAFNMATGTTWIFTIIATVVAVTILRVSRRLGSRGWSVALGLLLGGAVGNLVDRLLRDPGFARGHVVDFIEYLKFPFMDFPIFNVADSAITCAAVLILVLGLRGIALDGTREPLRQPRDADGAAGPSAGSDA